MYQVQLADLGDDVIKRARTFAENVVDETQNKFPYNYNRRIDTIYIGKLAQEAFIYYANRELGVRLETNYDIYEGIEKILSFDHDLGENAEGKPVHFFPADDVIGMKINLIGPHALFTHDFNENISAFDAPCCTKRGFIVSDIEIFHYHVCTRFANKIGFIDSDIEIFHYPITPNRYSGK